MPTDSSNAYDIEILTFTIAANTRLNKAPAKFRNLDYSERHGYLRGVVREIVHDAGQFPRVDTVDCGQLG